MTDPARPRGSLLGRLLVAGPGLVDPNFARSVVFVLHHDDGGSLGLVLNRPSPMPLEEPLPQWLSLAAAPAVVFFGGPVGAGSAICLARSAPEATGRARSAPEATDRAAGFDGWRPLVGRLGTLDLVADPGAAGARIEALRVFAGYAGWSPGQLGNEIAAGGWLVVEARDGDVLTGDPQSLWKAVLRRQPAELAALASFPTDLSAN